ncbi:MAG: cytochrome c peroxidase, partial [Bacteroidia bacterium]
MKKITILSVLTLLLMFIFNACNKETELVKDDTAYQLNYGDFPAPQLAQDNPLTIQGVALGRKLFYEKALSKDGSQMCASCHIQENAFTDLDRFSAGVEGFLGGRQSMAIFNMAWHNNEFFWDGRAHLLRDQALLPIQDSLELNESLENVIAKLKDLPYYTDQFVRAFGSDEITALNISLALEQFMLTIVSNNSKYDDYLAGNATLSTSELNGEELFFAEYNEFFPNVSGADCAHCHGGFNFENDNYMNNGLDIDADFEDLGRFKATGDPQDNAKFKVPSLRNIELTPPFMHDGRFATLEDVVEHYNSGIHTSSTVDPALLSTQNTGLMLSSQDQADLVAFLKTLTDLTITTNPEFS